MVFMVLKSLYFILWEEYEKGIMSNPFTEENIKLELDKKRLELDKQCLAIYDFFKSSF